MILQKSFATIASIDTADCMAVRYMKRLRTQLPRPRPCIALPLRKSLSCVQTRLANSYRAAEFYFILFPRSAQAPRVSCWPCRFSNTVCAYVSLIKMGDPTSVLEAQASWSALTLCRPQPRIQCLPLNSLARWRSSKCSPFSRTTSNLERPSPR